MRRRTRQLLQKLWHAWLFADILSQTEDDPHVPIYIYLLKMRQVLVLDFILQKLIQYGGIHILIDK